MDNKSEIIIEIKLLKSSTVKKYLIVENEGKRNISRNMEYCNLDVINWESRTERNNGKTNEK